MKQLIFTAFAIVCGIIAHAETIYVKAGETLKIPEGETITGDLLIKEGPGSLDLSAATLKNKGIDIREGAVCFTGGKKSKTATITTRFFQFVCQKSRPENKGVEYPNSGVQISEIRFFKDGKMLTIPAGSIAFSNGRMFNGEEPPMAIDNNLNTKWYCTSYNTPLIICFAKPLTIDGYSFATANDANGRDPCSWTVFTGLEKNGDIYWIQSGAEHDYEAPEARLKDIGKIFSLQSIRSFPICYQIKIAGKAKLILEKTNASIQNFSGCGLIELRNANVAFPANTKFKGSVSGTGNVNYQK